MYGLLSRCSLSLEQGFSFEVCDLLAGVDEFYDGKHIAMTPFSINPAIFLQFALRKLVNRDIRRQTASNDMSLDAICQLCSLFSAVDVFTVLLILVRCHCGELTVQHRYSEHATIKPVHDFPYCGT